MHLPLRPPLPDPRHDTFSPTTLEETTSQTAAFSPQTTPESGNLAWRSIREALALSLFALPLAVALSTLKWTWFLPSETNTKGIEDMTKLPAWQLVAMMVVFFPVVEEMLFRGIPILFYRLITRGQSSTRLAYDESWRAQNRLFWIFAIVTSIVFSALHGVGSKTFVLPLPQLIVGFFLWRAALNRGLRYSILMHATYNGVAAILVLIALQVKR